MSKIDVFIEMVQVYSKLSKDPRTKVGAMILRPDFSLVSTGYNGFPPGFPDTEDYWSNRDIKNAIVIHAEENALDYAKGEDLTGCTLICTHYPCPRCAAKIIKRKISNVIYLNDKREDHSCGLTDKLFNEVGITVTRK